MTLFVQNDAVGAGTGSLDPQIAAVNLAVIAMGDTGLGLAAQVGDRQQVTYARTNPGIPATRLDLLVNTPFTPDYGAGPQAVDIVILAVKANFFLNDGRSIVTVGGTVLPPAGSGLVGATINTSNACLVVYDTSQSNGNGYCLAEVGMGGALDLPTPNSVILYHELSHALRVVTNALLALTVACNPSSPEEHAAITDENDLRTQIATATGDPVLLRDPGNHCGASCGGTTTTCCIVASVATGSPLSDEVAKLRTIRDSFIRRSEIGYAFFHSLNYGYYAFSPQIAALTAGDLALRNVVLEGFVRPLIITLQLIQAYALSDADAENLGRGFRIAHPDRAAAAARSELQQGAVDALIDGTLPAAQASAARLLVQRALPDSHVVWALVEPLLLYREALQAFLDGRPDTEVGQLISDGIAAWAARLPLDTVWGQLSIAEVQTELEQLESTLIRDVHAQQLFEDRLAREYGHVTAVATTFRQRKESERTMA